VPVPFCHRHGLGIAPCDISSLGSWFLHHFFLIRRSSRNRSLSYPSRVGSEPMPSSPFSCSLSSLSFPIMSVRTETQGSSRHRPLNSGNHHIVVISFEIQNMEIQKVFQKEFPGSPQNQRNCALKLISFAFACACAAWTGSSRESTENIVHANEELRLPGQRH